MGFKRVLLNRIRVDDLENNKIADRRIESLRTITDFSIDRILSGDYHRKDQILSNDIDGSNGVNVSSNILCNFRLISESIIFKECDNLNFYQKCESINIKCNKELSDFANNNSNFEESGKINGSLIASNHITAGNFAVFIHDEASCICQICDKVFENATHLENHFRTHRTSRYECDLCGKTFSQLRNYKYHISIHAGTREFAAKCPECGKIFNDKGYLSSHLKIHRNRKEYACPHCPKCFNQRVAFNMHVRIHTGVKPHKCVECGKRFSRKMLLKQHMRTHSGEKPYECSVCGKTFADRSNMTLHQRLHSGVKPFSCPICPKAFTKKHHLKTHLNYHTGYKPYRCPFVNCGQLFTQSSNMRTHAKKCQFRQ